MVQEGPHHNTWPLAIVPKVLSLHVTLVKIRNTITKRSTSHLYSREMEVPWSSFLFLSVADAAASSIDTLEEASDPQPGQYTGAGRAVKKPSRLRINH